MSYDTYGGKQRDNWLEFRIMILEAKNRGTCEHCGGDLKYPEVHHLTYKNGLFSLNLDDYAILCHECHENIKRREKVDLPPLAFVRVPHNETLLYEGIREGRCRPPQSNSKFRQERRSQGLCEMSCRSCEGEIKKCPDCGFNYCEYHFDFHINFRQTCSCKLVGEMDQIRYEKFLKDAARLFRNSSLRYVLYEPLKAQGLLP